MKIYKTHWTKLFIFCSGLSLAAAFCMKWMESDLWAGQEPFTILGLEFSYSRDRIISIYSSIDQRVATVLRYHLYFDFVFMAGIFPGIASLCMIAAHRLSAPGLRRFLMALAGLQSVAWICDIIENSYLLNWMKDAPSEAEFNAYHCFVYIKWVIALASVLIAVICLLVTARKK